MPRLSTALLYAPIGLALSASLFAGSCSNARVSDARAASDQPALFQAANSLDLDDALERFEAAEDSDDGN